MPITSHISVFGVTVSRAQFSVLLHRLPNHILVEILSFDSINEIDLIANLPDSTVQAINQEFQSQMGFQLVVYPHISPSLVIADTVLRGDGISAFTQCAISDVKPYNSDQSECIGVFGIVLGEISVCSYTAPISTLSERIDESGTRALLVDLLGSAVVYPPTVHSQTICRNNGFRQHELLTGALYHLVPNVTA